MKKRLAVVAMCMLFADLAFALSQPTPSLFDGRVATVEYRRADVVQLGTVPGIHTHIEVEAGENYVTHAFGDSHAYVLAIKNNHYFLKPTALNADTNLTIVTDRRVYIFNLNFSEKPNAKAIYDLSYTYPDTMAKLAKEQAEKASVEAAFKERRGKANTEYSMAGDMELAPLNVWDDQEFTYLKFPANAPAPGVYLVDANGNESLASRVTAGEANDVVVVQGVNQKWMLRLGEDSAMAIYNDAYDRVGVRNTSGTKSPYVKRVLKGAQ